MADIFHDLAIKAPAERVYEAMTTPQGLDCWWTKTSSGTPQWGAEYELYFGPSYDWRGIVTRCIQNTEFELRIVRAWADWVGTIVGFHLDSAEEVTWVRFYHSGWPDANEHFRISNHCWALYLRLLRRYLEYGEIVPYYDRGSV